MDMLQLSRTFRGLAWSSMHSEEVEGANQLFAKPASSCLQNPCGAWPRQEPTSGGQKLAGWFEVSEARRTPCGRLLFSRGGQCLAVRAHEGQATTKRGQFAVREVFQGGRQPQ